MNTNFKAVLFTAAVSGLLTGTAVRAHAATPAEGVQAGGGQTQYTTQTSTSSTHLLYSQATTDKHSCKGQNSCKGQGGCKSSDNGCKGKNSCKGKGGCATDGSKMPKFA